MPADSRLNIIISLKNEASKQLAGLKGDLNRMNSSIKAARGASFAFAGALTAVGIGVGKLGQMAIGAADQFEQSNIAFTTMLGSADKAQTMLKKLAAFARKTPFELTGIEDNAKQLLAMGIEEKKLLPTLKMLGDVSAGLNVPLWRLALNFGQVKTQGKLTGRELRDFAVSGVPLIAELATQLGVAKEEVAELVSAGEIGFAEVEQVFKNLTQEGGRFENLMEKQSTTLKGMTENLKDAWNIFLRGEGAALLVWGKQLISMLIEIVDKKLPLWIATLKEMGVWFKEHKVALMIVVGAMVGALIPAIIAVSGAFLALMVTLAPFMLGGMVVAGLVAGLWWVYNNTDQIRDLLGKAWGGMTDTIATGMFNISKIIGGAVKEQRLKIMIVWKAIGRFFTEIWEDIKKTFSSAIDWIMSKVNSVMGMINRVRSAMSGIGARVGGMLSFAGGGIVPGPTGMAVPAIVHAGERIIPASGRMSGGAGGITINIRDNTLLDDNAAEEIGDRIIEILKVQRRFVI